MVKITPSSKQQKYKELGDWIRKKRGSRSQDWLADLLGVSRIFISQVENGHKRFSPYFISQLATIFKSDVDQLAAMAGWELSDVLDKYKQASLLHIGIESLISQSLSEIDIARHQRESGEPEQAIDMLDYWIELLDKRIRSDRDNSKDIRELNRIIVKAYCQRMICTNDISENEYAVANASKDFAKASALALLINDYEAYAIAHSAFAGSHYINRDYAGAKELALKALPFLKNDKTILSETIRGLMLDHANLNEFVDYQKHLAHAQDLLNHGDIHSSLDLSIYYEGLAKSKIQFGDLSAISDILIAEKEINKMNENLKNKPLRNLQINRTKLLYFKKVRDLQLTLNENELIGSIQKAQASIINLKNYSRYKQEIQSLINSFNLKPRNELRDIPQLRLF